MSVERTRIQNHLMLTVCNQESLLCYYFCGVKCYNSRSCLWSGSLLHLVWCLVCPVVQPCVNMLVVVMDIACDIHCMPYQTVLTFPGMFISLCHCDITVIMKKYRSHLELVGNDAMNVQWSYWLNALLIFQLQIAFSKGLLKPGLNLEVEAPKEAINNVVSTYFSILCLIILIKHFLVWVVNVNVSIAMIQVIVLFYLPFDCNCQNIVRVVPLNLHVLLI